MSDLELDLELVMVALRDLGRPATAREVTDRLGGFPAEAVVRQLHQARQDGRVTAERQGPRSRALVYSVVQEAAPTIDEGLAMLDEVTELLVQAEACRPSSPVLITLRQGVLEAEDELRSFVLRLGNEALNRRLALVETMREALELAESTYREVV